jgi:hypothetical protein
MILESRFKVRPEMYAEMDLSKEFITFVTKISNLIL